MKANTLPILLKNPKILLIGGGKVALQKACKNAPNLATPRINTWTAYA